MNTQIDWRALVEMVTAHDPKEKDTAYRFSNGREFEREPDGELYSNEE